MFFGYREDVGVIPALDLLKIMMGNSIRPAGKKKTLKRDILAFANFIWSPRFFFYFIFSPSSVVDKQNEVEKNRIDLN